MQLEAEAAGILSLLICTRKGGDSGAPSSRFGRRVAEGFDERCGCEDLADQVALEADAASMDNPDVTEPEGMRLFQICLHCRLYVARREGVEVKGVGDRDMDRFVVHPKRLRGFG